MFFACIRLLGVSQWHPDPVAACEAAEAGAGTSNYSSIEGKTFQTKHHQK
jgi:hypothetical protein